ncbi:hypothetical protein K3X41_01965 [Aliiroseovarius crassostreae]|uniref:hypothetical protein n=1 Tax=Aliiroseovarius crassostreae TaxID=154981 RepID=UPI00220D145C|nr:hypothetical protein [Aliiroseovarius crassostreae]UWP92646.1 hypothetical protein K3X13_01925 [Aliiroseovarius crassostreae]UWP98958.1 hypothetical protein K3X53_01965 [Aliiroseovarius crassostreae]UWQ04127.1 hypothetical protein K3X22_10585 [Aliiroseovarius crassostreae]UWQ08392.1 hypothetical protein K3X25_01975 [Aliiroseovarius crassostreae]UWQ11491.1 hypothetical protein K3X41_01965 [Aliiroseovarius crassostreae]
MTPKLHAAAGTIAFLSILTFWSSTLITELFAGHETITMVKRLVLYGLVVLIPAMATVGATGMALGKTRKGPIIAAKKKRMPVIALAGLGVLLPAAFFLDHKAQSDEFDLVFYVVQGIELLAGGVNLTLMGLNIRDGLRMTAKRRQARARKA